MSRPSAELRADPARRRPLALSRSRPRRLRPPGRDALVTLSLAAGAFALALLQRPGWAASDTKIDLHVDPGRFLLDVASTWTSSGGLGQVHGGQYAGYLWPMGPFFAAGHALGLSPWLVHRLWLGLLLTLAAWGTLRLLRALLDGPSALACLVGGALMIVNPYVVVFSNRTSVTLLAYAALPWLLLAVHRGVRHPRSWWWPAAFALIVASAAGGVNAALPAWVLAGPLLLLLYEALALDVRLADAGRFALRCVVTGFAASLWWIAPVAVHAAFGLNFLRFTESNGAIWTTTSLSESFRLMGFWLNYLGVGYGERLVPFFDDGPTMLFSPAVVVAGLVVPALALGGFVWTRRWRYGPFFLLMTLIGALVMTAGYPEGSPLRHALSFAYNNVDAIQFLRTTYKIGPLVAVGIACLGGAAAAELWRRARPRLRRSGGPRPGAARRMLAPRALAAAGLAAGAAALIALWGWPLIQGRAVDRQVSWKRIPPAWRQVGHDLDRGLPPNSRALVLPGQLYAFYRWGATIDPILLPLSRRPVAVRTVPPYADLHSTDLLWTVDSLVQQQRLVPGQLRGLLGLISARSVVTGTDDDPVRAGSMPPAAAERQLQGAGQLGSPSRAYGPLRRFQDSGGSALALPEVRRYDLPPGRGLVRMEPVAPETIVDGSADALAGLAAFGALPREQPLRYAGDVAQAGLRRAAQAGSDFVISDSNRRRAVVSSWQNQNAGATLGASDPIAADGATLDPFPPRGSAAQTVAVYDGARYVRSPFSPAFPQFPEHRPYAALDGSTRTWWLADRNLERPDRWLEVGFERPRDVPYVDLLPAHESRTAVTEVTIAGRRFRVHPGWNRIQLGLRGVGSLRVALSNVHGPANKDLRGPGAIAELRIPGLHVRELLRPPLLAERALSGGAAARVGLTYLLSRTTGDDPFHRAPLPDPDRGGTSGARRQAALISRPGDGERELTRRLLLPAARSFAADAWVSAAPDAPDEALDALAGARALPPLRSSSRFQSLARNRASSAFDADPLSAWIADRPPGAVPWIEWRASRSVRVRELRLTPAREAVPFPARVRLRFGGGPDRGSTPQLPVLPGGRVRLPKAVDGRDFRLEVTAVRSRRGVSGLRAEAVGIGELSGPGVPRVRVPRRGAIASRCGAVQVRIAGRALALRPSGTIEQLDAGAPLRASACGAPTALPAGQVTLTTASGVFATDLLRLRSPAPVGRARSVGGGRVLDPGRAGRGRYDDVRLALNGPAWLVLGESYNRGWRATCDGRSLGAPVVIDGFANGWRVRGACRHASFAFAPDGPVRWAYALSALACLLLLALLLLRRPPRSWAEGAGGTRDGHGVAPKRAPAGYETLARVSGRRALAVGLACGLVFAFVFSLRAGAVIGPAIALLLWRPPRTRTLVVAAAALLGLVAPLLYLVVPVDDMGGFNSDYANNLIAGHWVAVAAWMLLALALWRSLVWLRRNRRSTAARKGP